MSDKDFVNLDEKELTRPRQAHGDLPVMGFLHPAPQSVFVDKGVDIGVPFKGAAPDLGAFEGETDVNAFVCECALRRRMQKPNEQ
jgi:hypothetical protein